MHFAFTDEQEDLRRTVRTLLDRRGGPDVPPPEAPAAAHDAALWARMAEQIGTHGLAVPEEHGGSGAGLVEALIVVEELGRRLVTSPYLGSAVLCSQVLLAAGDPGAAARLLPGIASGGSVAALAWAEQEHRWDTSACAALARRDGDRWLLTGRKLFVLDGAEADVLLVVATTGTRPSLFEVDPGALPHARTDAVPMDPTRRWTGFTFHDAPARLIGAAGGAEPALARCRDVAAAALAAEQVGAAQRWLGETVEYTKVREQFGRPIGSFQALKHRLADLFVAVESARSMSWAASWAVAHRTEQAAEWAAMAKSYCSETYAAVAAEGVQLHGGLGITWEHEAHLHLKRAHSSAQLFGTPRDHRRRLEAALLRARP
ncbi:acyl-CoA dehydrogenase family protein [Saccharopolyspora cebuensis]|uniref:Acyl-CoA dehydrogenase family protein n=1 Tax=Saccharopolyspora cebuensis TaxID=418759 RepID=A0ABV4CFF8_9PSEU